MSYLANPCPCGHALDDNEDGTIMACAACGRHYVRRSWGLEQLTPKEDIVDVRFCCHRRPAGFECPHCPDGKAVVK